MFNLNFIRLICLPSLLREMEIRGFLLTSGNSWFGTEAKRFLSRHDLQTVYSCDFTLISENCCLAELWNWTSLCRKKVTDIEYRARPSSIFFVLIWCKCGRSRFKVLKCVYYFITKWIYLFGTRPLFFPDVIMMNILLCCTNVVIFIL